MRRWTRWAIAVVCGVPMASGCDSPLEHGDPPPNDRPIVYRCECPSGAGLYRVNLDGSEAVLLTPVHSTSSIAWSPDETKIAYDDFENPEAQDSRSQIYVINADGTGKHALTSFEDGAGAWQPAWSPDGSRILFVRSVLSNSDGDFKVDRGIYAMNPDGSGVQRLTPANDPALYGGPSWSPDGSTIAFYKGILDEETSVYVPHLYLMNSDGSQQQALTTETIHTSLFNKLAWSPQGDLIAFEVYGPGAAGANIATIKPDGSQLKRLTNQSHGARSPSWSPNGRQLVFQSSATDGDNQPHLYVINRNGGGKRRLTTSSSWEGYPAWAPSTAWIR